MIWPTRVAHANSTGLQVCNRSKVTCLVSFAQAAQQLAQHAVELTPAGDVTIPARDALDMTFFYRCGHLTGILFANAILLTQSWKTILK